MPIDLKGKLKSPMIAFNKFVFATPPRTGTVWFLKACEIAGMSTGSRFEAHSPPPSKFGGYCVSIVRHPFTWLESYYDNIKGSKISVQPVDKFSHHCLNSDSFEEFVNLVLKWIPGGVGRMFDDYNPTSVFRLEDLPWAAIQFLQSNVDLSRDQIDRIVQLGKQNISKEQVRPKNQSLWNRVVQSERIYCDRYDYD